MCFAMAWPCFGSGQQRAQDEDIQSSLQEFYARWRLCSLCRYSTIHHAECLRELLSGGGPALATGNARSWAALPRSR